MSRSLHEKKILVTREKMQAKQFSEKILEYGGIPIEVPLLKISCKKDRNTEEILSRLFRYKWLFFTSSNGVHCFFQLLKRYHINVNQIQTINIAVVGNKTGNAVKEYGLTPSFKPTIYNAERMAKEFLSSVPEREPILLIRGNLSREVLPEKFNQLEIKFDTIEVYETIFDEGIQDRLNRVLEENTFNFITFTSPSTVEAFVQMIQAGELKTKAFNTICVCIGTTTEQRARKLGFINTVVPTEYTIDGMIECMSNFKERG
ncbi:uroporphyrinogen-III synthase [Ornithinibacillus sp. L9]|uniref:Uroporphyrinogen-III synthase n=1 Tax=Ornithinibacillus caprae TaxID=2678566 RepID=A0A6N8FBN4_9BACI|nr:uroporphyrinogen-III synthase [Ornithinibacillus caprae]MUK86960.1 uroporphyrinogen-III synthase [Ornithinibacillus caprae]